MPSGDQMRRLKLGQNVIKAAEGATPKVNQLMTVSVTENDLRQCIFFVTRIFFTK